MPIAIARRAMIRIRSLGHASVIRGAAGESIETLQGHTKRLGLLVYLAVESASRPVRRDRLEALFWPDKDHERARASLRQSLFVLRQRLGEDLFQDGAPQLQLREAVVSCDAIEFQHLVERGRLGEAMALYEGPFLATMDYHAMGDRFERWVEVKHAALERTMLSTAARLSQEAEAEDEVERSIEWARRAVRLAPSQEPPVWRLVSLLHRYGERSEALDECEDFFARAWTHFGRAASPQLRGLARALRNDRALRPGGGPSEVDEPDDSPALHAHGTRSGERELLRAQGLMVLGEHREAAEILSGLLQYPQLDRLTHAEASLRLSEVYDHLGRRQESVERLGEFLGVLDELGKSHAGLAAQIRKRLDRIG